MLPNLIIIGAGKCGTTSLYHYLAQHPEVTMSKQKELRFFLEQGTWSRGVEWYGRQFDGADTPVRGESSPQYTHYPRAQGVPERMHGVIPGARLIYLVRDPIDRIVSAYVDLVASNSESRPFEVVMRSPRGEQLLAESSYHLQLQRFLRLYPQERILVVSRERLLRTRLQALRSVFEFLSVDPGFDSPNFDQIRNPSDSLRRVHGPRWIERSWRPKPTGRIPWVVRARVKRAALRPFAREVPRPEVGPELREAMTERLGPEAERLRRLTGERFDEWSL